MGLPLIVTTGPGTSLPDAANNSLNPVITALNRPYVSWASGAGTLNNVAPTGFGTTTGRLDVSLPSGPATWTGLLAGVDPQPVILRNVDATNTLTLAILNGGSLNANMFSYSPGNVALPPGMALLLYYYSQSSSYWVVLP